MTIDQKEWIEKRIEKIIHTADIVKFSTPYVAGLAETIKRDIRKLRKYLEEIDKEGNNGFNTEEN